MTRTLAIVFFWTAFAAVSIAAPGGRYPDQWSGQRHYAPDRSAGIHHLALDITPDFQRRTISGTAVVTFQPIAKPLEELQLDAIDLNIQSVTSSAKIQAYEVTADHVVITFAEPVPPTMEASVSIHYTAQPEKGLYFRTPEMGYVPGDEHLFTQGETVDERYWYPSYDSPNQKFTTEITCHVPNGMTALSNGRLVSEEKDGAGLTAFHWSQEQPHANYLVSLVAGYFKKVEDKYKDVPLAMLTPTSEIEEAPNSFRDTRDIMAFYESEIGVPYPWAKYYQVIVQDFMEGGMENTSITTLTDRTLFTEATENIRSSQGLVAHEMAHQWFGDLVTCKDWSETWLNEGFATFYAELYDEHKNGEDAMLYALYGKTKSIFSVSNDIKPIVSRNFDNPDSMFNFLQYDKGSFVLRMLRYQLGPDLYRQCIRAYLERHKFGNVDTEDLARVVEELSGRSYDQFFDQWVYHAHYPEVEASYSWDEKSKLAKISLRQNQKTGDDVFLFNFPLEIAFKGGSGTVTRTITVKEKSEDFYFSLDSAPTIVRLDPNLAVLAKIDFRNRPSAMLDAQLDDENDVVGRLQAIDELQDSKNHETVEKLSHALNHDRFYGVRIEAAGALQAVHNDEALEALLKSTKQSDARVRNRVMGAIAGFYEPRALDAERNALSTEQNPDVLAQSIRALAKYPASDTRPLLLPLLQSKSYRNTTLEAAISTLCDQEDPGNIAPVRDTVSDLRQSRRLEKGGTAQSRIALRAIIPTSGSESKSSLVLCRPFPSTLDPLGDFMPVIISTSKNDTRDWFSNEGGPNGIPFSHIPGTVKLRESLQQSWRIYFELKSRKSEIQARGFSSGLASLATLAVNCDKKDEVRDFIISYVNDNNETIQLGAIRALGTLGDAGAIPVLQTFAGANRADQVQRAATGALEAIRSGRKRDENSAELRQTVLDLQDQVKKLRQDLDSMQKKLNAKDRSPSAPAKKPSRQ